MLEHLINSLINDYVQNQNLQKLDHYDPLKNVANRRLFEDRANEVIKRTRRFKEPLSLLYFDLDGFKEVNDTLSHAVGDLVLIKFVNLITQCCRATDILARLGGDEFVLLLPNTPHEALVSITDKIRTLLLIPCTLDNKTIEIKVSIGAVSVNEQSLTVITLDKLLKCTDMSVYEAKKVKGTFTHFSSSF